MGYRHYKEMLMQATEVDCRALGTFIDLLAYSDKFEDDLDVGSFWDDMSVDRIMVCARKITCMHGEFIEGMQDLLVSGCFEVKARNKLTGEVLNIDDVDIFNFDVPIVDVKLFHQVLVAPATFTKGNSASNN